MTDLTISPASDIQVDFLSDQTPAVSSLEVARRFQKKHLHILRDIDRIRSQVPKIFFESNFGFMFNELTVGNGATRKSPYCLLTRDAFSLLVMGFTGSAAIRWKLKYIEAFNALEQGVLEQQLELARESGYQQGLEQTRALPAVEADRKIAYLEGLKEGKKLQKRQDGLLRLEKVLNYLQRGFSQNEIARVLSTSRSTVQTTVKKYKSLIGAKS